VNESYDFSWLEETYPGFEYNSQDGRIRCVIPFRMYYYEKEPDIYVINPDETYKQRPGCLIEDIYEVDIFLDNELLIPRVKERGGRILRSKEKWGLRNLIDMHVFLDHTLCLCPFAEQKIRLPNGFNFHDFFENLLIPYFYYQSFFEQYGYEPWKGASHGDLGILESYSKTAKNRNISLEILYLYLANLSPAIRNNILKKVPIMGHHLCKCGSGRIFRKCHQEALTGYKKMLLDCSEVKLGLQL